MLELTACTCEELTYPTNPATWTGILPEAEALLSLYTIVPWEIWDKILPLLSYTGIYSPVNL